MIDIMNVSRVYGYGSGSVVALDNVDLSIADGEFVAVVGPSGSGKSTLLNVIGGLERVSSGRVFVDNERIDNLSEENLVQIRRSKVAYVFQQYHLIPYLNAWENVFLPVALKGPSSGDPDKVSQLLREVGLAKRSGHKPSQLSGGEQQRVAIARALVNGCPVILADEPTGNVDQKTGADILGIFQRLNHEGRTIVMVTHSSEVARRSSRIVTMQDGKIVGDSPHEPELPGNTQTRR